MNETNDSTKNVLFHYVGFFSSIHFEPFYNILTSLPNNKICRGSLKIGACLSNDFIAEAKSLSTELETGNSHWGANPENTANEEKIHNLIH